MIGEIKNGVLILNRNVTFEEYARNQNIKEIILESAVRSIDGGGFRDCYHLEKITIYDSFQDMGALAFASSPLHLLNVIMKNGEKISIEFIDRITGNDIMNTIRSLKEGKLVGNFSQSFYKYVILLALYDYGHKENAKILKKNIFKIACKLIDHKLTKCFVDLCKYKELFTKKDVDKLIAYSENKKVIKKIKEALYTLSLSYREANENDEKEKFTIEKNWLISIDQRSWNEFILPETIKTIAKGIFESITIKKLVLPSTLKKITGQNFKNCKYIKEIVISEGTESIAAQAFMGCTNLIKITLPSTIQTIGQAAFSNCSKLKEVIIPENVAKIEDKAFCGCTNLIKITLPSTIQTIGQAAFSDCSNLEEVTIPENVAKIEDKAFYGCTKLKRITFLSFINTSGQDLERMREYFSSLFGECSHLSKIVMAKESTDYTIRDNVIYDKKVHEIIFIPYGVKNVQLPLSLKHCDLYQNIDKLSFSLSSDSHIRMNMRCHEYTYVNVIECTAGDKTWTFDLEAQKSVLFEEDYEYMKDGLYCNKKCCLNELTNKVLEFLENGNVCDVSDLGEIAYLDNSECGLVHYASLFELRFQLATFASEIYHKNFLEISRQLISYAIENYYNEESAQEYVRDYFKYHPEHLFSMEKFPKLLEIGLTAAIEQGEAKYFEQICAYLNADNIDEYIRISIDNGFTELTILLIDYKNKIGAYKSIEEKFKL